MRRVTGVFLLLASLILGTSSLWAGAPATGVWMQVSEKEVPESVVLIYQSGKELYGRMVASFGDDGKVYETIAAYKERATKLQGEPSFMNLDYIYQMRAEGSGWSGLIMDPRSGDEYDCKMWREGTKLMVRGQLKGLLGMFGKTASFVPLPPGILPPDLKIPDPAGFSPVIPKKK